MEGGTSRIENGWSANRKLSTSPSTLNERCGSDETTPNEQKQWRKWGLFRLSHIVCPTSSEMATIRPDGRAYPYFCFFVPRWKIDRRGLPSLARDSRSGACVSTRIIHSSTTRASASSICSTSRKTTMDSVLITNASAAHSLRYVDLSRRSRAGARAV